MPRVTGEIRAEFAVRGGRTQLVGKYQTSPLKIAKTFRYENETLLPDKNTEDQLGVYVMDCSPGLMAGDHYELNWRIGPGAKVFLTNQSFTKIHPAKDGVGSTQKQVIMLDQDALLEYIPEPVMLYKDACYAGETEVYASAGSTLVWTDVLCPGRAQRGEIFQYESYANRLKVSYEGELIFYQNQQVLPSEMKLDAPGSWGPDTHMGSLFVCSDRIGLRQLERLNEQLSALNVREVRYGASLTYKHGLMLTVLGRNAWQLQDLLTKAWVILRSSLLSLAPLTIHK
ncbi:urease accessory protein UreD [Paenibacillus hexagrammi]|uniref:Urease accessory protein UreD n=1 Tax=Paenibacillus hexagrammi TaxID=2908839 RepID=A0ABY3SGH2_9BACL|nr:urease accessory protein UreD [Paenibacillus sp. YPD9-1]UJF32301.1 urease accessory protein UreD [Paenibacillus sp. YPD9-1]